ncbi:flagellar hook-length control protein FliK, partial [bacterium]|nr:flagellar hook-length control protein FliK [bacterium]
RDFSDILLELKDSFFDSYKVDSIPKRETIDQLFRILWNIFDFTEEGFTSDKIRQLIKNFSISYEREIAQSTFSKDGQIFGLKDIKGSLKFLLLSLLGLLENSMEDNSTTEFAEGKKFSKLIKGLLYNLDINNIQGHQSESGMLFFHVPIVFGEEKSKLDFVMDFKDKDEDRETTDIEITIFTELTGLGKMRIAILLKENQVFSSITLFERSSAEFLKNNMDILSRSLSGLGFEECNFFTNILCDENLETYIVPNRYFQKIPIVDFHV